MVSISEGGVHRVMGPPQITYWDLLQKMPKSSHDSILSLRRGSRPSSGARRVGRCPVRGAADRCRHRGHADRCLFDADANAVSILQVIKSAPSANQDRHRIPVARLREWLRPQLIPNRRGQRPAATSFSSGPAPCPCYGQDVKETVSHKGWCVVGQNIASSGKGCRVP